jgi:thiol-disulfide isomerase/thioredoxin
MVRIPGKLRSALLYTAVAFFANAAQADTAALEALREGDMQKLVFMPNRGRERRRLHRCRGRGAPAVGLAGKVVLLNFWATWCAPCRKEMPMLEALQAEFGGDAFEVVPVATGRNSVQGITRFFEEIGVANLPILLDPGRRSPARWACSGFR